MGSLNYILIMKGDIRVKENIAFYDEYFSFPAFDDMNRARIFKDAYIREKVFTDYIYKFISFTEDEELNKTKIQLIRDKKLWVSNYKNFVDKNEVSVRYNMLKVSRKAQVPSGSIRFLIDTGKQMNDVSCFTYDITPFMWKYYANNSNGLCLIFKLIDTDKFFPVIYLDKSEIDFTDDLLHAFQTQDFKYISRLSILPWVLKDKNFRQEDELRFLCGDIYDSEDGVMGGRIAPDKKELLGYKGTTYAYEYAGIKLSDILIGSNCKDDCKKEIITLLDKDK